MVNSHTKLHFTNYSISLSSFSIISLQVLIIKSFRISTDYRILTNFEDYLNFRNTTRAILF